VASDFELEVLTSLSDIRERVTRVEVKLDGLDGITKRVSDLESKRASKTAVWGLIATFLGFMEPVIKSRFGVALWP